MAVPFIRTLKSLEAGQGRPFWALATAATVLLGAWCAWFFLARLTVYRTTSRGRIEAHGGLHIVAEFLASESLGRVQPGQRARIRLDAFPWTQYGAVEGRVLRIAAEPDKGYIRVEIAALESRQIPLEHGMTGAVEAEVEEVSPATLVLRSAGQLLGAPAGKPLPETAGSATSG